MAKGRTTIRVGAVALASAAALAGTASMAGASTKGTSLTTPVKGKAAADVAPTLSGIQSQAKAAITDRVNALNAAIGKVKSAKGLGSGQATLESYLGADIGPLQALGTKIAGDSTVQEATTDFGTIYSNFRVYRLVLPAARLAGAADRVTATTIPKGQAAVTKVQQHETSANQSSLAPLISDVNTQIATASKATNGLASTVLGYTPAQWNANNGLLGPAQASIKQTAAAVKQGHKDLKQMRSILIPGGVAHAKSGTTGGQSTRGKTHGKNGFLHGSTTTTS